MNPKPAHTSRNLESTDHEAHKLVTSGVVPLTRSQLIGTLAGLMLGMLLAALDQTIVGTAEPKIISHLGGFERYPWVSTTYLLSSTISVPIFAKLSDLYGRKWFFLAGNILFVLGSALCGAAGELRFIPLDGMNQLVVFRGLQGIGAGALMGLAFTIIGDIFSPAERGKYQALFSAMWAGASVLGPTLGGWLTDNISWRAVFYVNLPVGVIATATILIGLPNFHPQSSSRKVDWAGIIFLILCMVPLLLGLTWVSKYGWSSTRVESSLGFALVMLVVFLYVETKSVEPLVPLVLFKNPVIGLSCCGMFVLGMGMFAVIVYLPLFMQGVLGVSATRSGNLLLPLMLGVVTGSAASGQFISRLKSYKASAWAGSVAVAIGMILFSRMTAATQQFEVMTAMIIAGLGMGFVMPAYTVAVQNAAPRSHMGAATSSTMFFRSIGSTVGVAIFGSVLLTNYHHDFAMHIPPGLPNELLRPFSNPLMLGSMKDELRAAFSQYPGGEALLKGLLEAVPVALIHGLRLIFLSSAIIMSAAIALNFFIEDRPLRSHQSIPEDAIVDLV